jgi:hypothetical protein
MWQARGIAVVTFGSKAPGHQLALAPLCTPLAFGRQRLVRLELPDDLVDLGAVERALDPQQNGQSHEEIAIGHQQVARGNVAVLQEALDRFLALAEQQGQFTGLPEIIDRRLRIAVAQQHCFGGLAGHQLDALAIHARKHISDRAAIVARFGHHRSKRLPNIRGVTPPFGERLDMVRPPDPPLIAGSWINSRAAHLVTEQPRTNNMSRLVSGDPHILLERATDRGKEFTRSTA